MQLKRGSNKAAIIAAKIKDANVETNQYAWLADPEHNWKSKELLDVIMIIDDLYFGGKLKALDEPELKETTLRIFDVMLQVEEYDKYFHLIFGEE